MYLETNTENKEEKKRTWKTNSEKSVPGEKKRKYCKMDDLQVLLKIRRVADGEKGWRLVRWLLQRVASSGNLFFLLPPASVPKAKHLSCWLGYK